MYPLIAAAIDRPTILTVRLGASHRADTDAVAQDEAMRTVFIRPDRRLPCATWVTYFPKSLFVVSQLWHRSELRA
jgi:hypothetical protein